MRARIQRRYYPRQTLGLLSLPGFHCYTIEPPWMGNEPFISCIPEGTYQVQYRWSERYKMHYEFLSVPDREFILIHPGNTWHDTKGCIIPGSGFAYVNEDKDIDVANSRHTLKILLDNKLNIIEIGS